MPVLSSTEIVETWHRRVVSMKLLEELDKTALSIEVSHSSFMGIVLKYEVEWCLARLVTVL